MRPSRPGDSAKLSSFFRDAWKESGPAALGFAGAKPESIEEIAAPEFLKRRLSSPLLMMVVAEEGPRVIGMATVRKTATRECEVSGIVGLQERDGADIDSRLLRKILEVAKKRGFVTVTAKVGTADERALSFYRAAGFTDSGKVADKTRNSSLRVLAKRLR